MIPNSGSWAKFTFINKLDKLNGIYQIQSVENFDQAASRGIDFAKTLYSLVGLTEDDWKNDYKNYLGQDVYWLQPEDNKKDAVPVPTGVLSLIPDLSVKTYYRLSLYINVGVYKNQDELSYLASHIRDIVSDTTGIKSNTYWSVDNNGILRLTDDDYTKLDNDRKANAKALMPLSAQVTLRDKQIDDLKARISYLEKALIEAISKNKS